MFIFPRMPVEWFCHQNTKIELFPQYKTGCGLINTVNVEHRKKKKKKKTYSMQATMNAISILTTANGKTMRNKSEKAKIFQIKKFLQASRFVYFLSDYIRL